MSRGNGSAFAVARLCIMSFVVAMAAMFATVVGSAVTATSADAATTPFWEQADKGRKAITGKRRYSKKSYRGTRTAKRHAGKRRYRTTTSRKARYSKKHNSRSLRSAKRAHRTSSKRKSYSSYPPSRSLTGGGVRWVASAGCLAGSLKSVVYQVASKFGPVTVNSTCRSKARNRAVGGAGKSKHLSGQAVDFRVAANVSAVYAYLKSSGTVGGLKHYGGGLFHIDTGPRRSW